LNNSFDIINKVLATFSLGHAEVINLLGGTATKKFEAQTSKGRFVVRIRPTEFATEALTRFDHAILQNLADMQLPVPCPQKNTRGTTWTRIDREVFEVLSWVEGNYFDFNDTTALKSLGEFLAIFHSLQSEKIPEGKGGWLREDHPDLLRQYATQLISLCKFDTEKEHIRNIDTQLDHVRAAINPIYSDLPKAVIHGDVHPGNLYFEDSKVSAVYDFDYLSIQARVRDISDAIIFFASNRDSAIIADDIHSLTASFKLNLERSLILLHGYHNINPLKEAEIQVLPEFMKSRWCQIRLRGSRKVEKSKKIDFVLNDFFEMIEHLNSAGPKFTKNILQSLNG
jgi:Ser/Thr protein kinase RdoA (MazF antagonist)